MILFHPNLNPILYRSFFFFISPFLAERGFRIWQAQWHGEVPRPGPALWDSAQIQYVILQFPAHVVMFQHLYIDNSPFCHLSFSLRVLFIDIICFVCTFTVMMLSMSCFGAVPLTCTSNPFSMRHHTSLFFLSCLTQICQKENKRKLLFKINFSLAELRY